MVRGLLKGRRIVVTAAAGTGIGFATARRCAIEGAEVVLSDRHEARLIEYTERLSNELGRPFASHPCDVTDESDIAALIHFGDEALEKRLSVNLYRPLSEGVLKSSLNGAAGDGDDAEGNLRAARDLIGEIIRLARPRSDELIYAVVNIRTSFE